MAASAWARLRWPRYALRDAISSLLTAPVLGRAAPGSQQACFWLVGVERFQRGYKRPIFNGGFSRRGDHWKLFRRLLASNSQNTNLKAACIRRAGMALSTCPKQAVSAAIAVTEDSEQGLLMLPLTTLGP